MRLPDPRGPLTEQLFAAFTRPVDTGGRMLPDTVSTPVEPLSDEDHQLALFACYQHHYTGFDQVDPRWEWQPGLVALRGRLEADLEKALDALVPGSARSVSTEPGDVPRRLEGIVRSGGGPSLSAYMRRHATFEQYREFLTHRSVYHLREADPHSWALPRLRGRAKAALVEIQADEYGQGDHRRMHSTLFSALMRGLALNDTYGAYLDAVPAPTLALNNTMSLFGLHRRLRGALLGHLAAFEMTSTGPNRDLSRGLRRLGAAKQLGRYFDEHVEADAVHEQVAAHDMCGSFAEDHPELADDVLFGAEVCVALDRLWAEYVLDRWQGSATSLRVAKDAVAT